MKQVFVLYKKIQPVLNSIVYSQLQKILCGASCIISGYSLQTCDATLKNKNIYSVVITTAWNKVSLIHSHLIVELIIVVSNRWCHRREAE